MKSRQSTGLRTVDVGRSSGYSVQQVRNLERDGVLPAAERRPSGYRRYGEIHVRSARAYRWLAQALGPVQAKTVMRVVHAGAGLPELLDAAHAALHAERRELRLAQRAAEAIAGEPVVEGAPDDAMTISELADALGVRASALRHWEAEGLVVPGRAGARDARLYAPGDVRDARIVHQLRLAGYRIPALRAVLPALRTADDGDIRGVLAARDADIDRRSMALLRAASALIELVGGSEWEG